MHIPDPIIGETRTKVGETSTPFPTDHDPIVGTTRTKVGETHTRANDYATNHFASDHYSYTPGTTYYSGRPRTYTHASSENAFGGVVALGLLFLVAAVIIGGSGPPSGPHHPRSLRPSYTPYSNVYSSGGYGYSSEGFGSSFLRQREWTCDIDRICNKHLSGRESGCYEVKDNCRWTYR